MSGNEYIWCRGRVMPSDEATVNVMSPTAQFGLNVFEGVRGYWNHEEQVLYFFRLHDHLKRLFDSCKLMGFDVPYSGNQIWNAISELSKKSEFRQDVALRITVFADGVGTWSSAGPFDMFISPLNKPRLQQGNIRGLKACISSRNRITDQTMPPRIKTGANYVAGRYAYLEAIRAGFDVPIFLNGNGYVSEGAGAAVFLVRNGVIITPSLQSSILESVTRDTIICLAKQFRIPVEERLVDRTELELADEVFFCGTAAEITPIISVNNMAVGSGVAGQLTLKLLDAYHRLATNQNRYDLPDDWLTQNTPEAFE